jgi:dolichol-phosphate mannosyltransferase
MIRKSINIVCPVFREEEVIVEFHARLAAVAGTLEDRYDVCILYVVDPSSDRTEEVLSEIGKRDPRVRLLIMSRRFGHQAAIVAGIDHSLGDAVIMLDSDLQHPPELIPELLRNWEAGADIVQTLRQDGSETDFTKRFMSKLFYRTLFRIGSVSLQIGAADYRLLSSRVARIFRDQVREHNPFLRGLVGWVGFNITYVPFKPARRERGKSKYRPSTLINFAVNGIFSFSTFPLRFCAAIGFVLALISAAGVLLQLAMYFISNRSAPGWASVFTIVNFIGGIQLIFLGVLGEYIAMIFEEVKNRPRYIIARDYRHGRATQATELPPSEPIVIAATRANE